ncbi:hypothetical protein DRE_06287 [Drechslerella stenobrocha 248]|uniref:Thiol-specific monooxygenase n=1 Tax=Drechslerella stenobrocha 248 TaxID=1043628 RepID=W7HY05_9PEZI|nr:hypothetical protein DRE_06287 [Drechslerella stenobrocha 248]
MMLPEIRKVAVIGGGPSGAVAAKCLLAEGLTPVIFEQRPSFGGVWNYTPETKAQIPRLPLEDPNFEDEPVSGPSSGDIAQPVFLSPMYPELETNITKDLMVFNKVPFAEELQLFPKHEDINKYVQEYSKDLIPFARFSHRVTRVSRGENMKWEVQRQDVISSRSEESTFDAVIIAAGHYSVPYIPTIAGIQEFEEKHPGSIQHSKYFRTTDGYQNKRVVVVGNSASGVDIATQISKVAKTPIYQSCKHLEGLFKEFPSTAEDKIKALPTIEEFIPESKTVRFKDGTCVSDVDVVLFCTGYLQSMPFLVESDNVSDRMVTDGFCVHRLYQHIFYIPCPTFAIIGLPMKAVPFPLAECQAAFVAGVFSGRLALPSEDEMNAWENDLASKRIADRHFHFLGFPADADYMDMLNSWSTKNKGSRQGLYEPTQWGEKERTIRKNLSKIKAAFMSSKASGKIAKTMAELELSFE